MTIHGCDVCGFNNPNGTLPAEIHQRHQ